MPWSTRSRSASAPSAVAVTRENVWVTNSGDGTVSRINAASNTVAETTPVGNVPVAIASGPSGVWVTNSGRRHRESDKSLDAR